ncbi:MAG TPA: hypothetical protein VGK67_27765 [Myxococcales bacterium]|jgi:hypothetical protein
MGKGKKKGEEFDLDALVPVYVPSLFDLLVTAEKKKGTPLTKDDVQGVRDSATVVMMHRDRAEEMMRTRPVADLDPDNAWDEWLKRRPGGS